MGFAWSATVSSRTGIGPTATTITVPLAAPTVSVPVSYRQSATDADNHGVAKIAAAYAQDQIQLTRRLQAIVGLRYDRFDVKFRNNRSRESLRHGLLRRCQRQHEHRRGPCGCRCGSATDQSAAPA